MKLGVNIDHVATLRQARGGVEPEPLQAAVTAQKAGADGITVHLREDRRHIQDADVLAIKKKIKKIPLNLEMSLNPDIVAFAFKEKGVSVSLFVEPEAVCIETAQEVGADFVELHTGAFARAFTADDAALWKKELIRLHNAAQEAYQRKIGVNAGHGLNYTNVEHVVKIPHIEELNIGHSIIARAVIAGLSKAVKEMKQLIEKYALTETQ